MDAKPLLWGRGLRPVLNHVLPPNLIFSLHHLDNRDSPAT